MVTTQRRACEDAGNDVCPRLSHLDRGQGSAHVRRHVSSSCPWGLGVLEQCGKTVCFQKVWPVGLALVALPVGIPFGAGCSGDLGPGDSNGRVRGPRTRGEDPKNVSPDGGGGNGAGGVGDNSAAGSGGGNDPTPGGSLDPAVSPIPASIYNDTSDNSAFPVTPLAQDSGSCRRRPTAPDAPMARRLTHREFLNTVRDTLGVDAKSLFAEVKADSLESGFKNKSIALVVGLDLAQSYGDIAEGIVDRVDNWSELIDGNTPCTQMNDDCQDDFIRGIGMSLFRGPVLEGQVETYRNLFAVADAQGEGFTAGAKLVVQAMLQSPRFIYRTENGAPGDDIVRLSGYEMLSRLSYLLWGTAPTKSQLARAEGLTNATAIADMVEEMVQDQKFEDQMVEFTAQWAAVEGVEKLDYQDDRYDGFADVRADMLKESRDFFREVLSDPDTSMLELYTAKFTNVSERLATFYGFDDVESGVAKYDLTDDMRIGMLTQGAFAGTHGHRKDPSLVERGVFIYGSLLCFNVPNVPNEIAMEAVPAVIAPGVTERSEAEKRAMREGCFEGSCHASFDPLAFPLEPFDGAGRLRAEDQFGNALQSDGVVTDPDIVDSPQSYENVQEFAEIMANSKASTECLSRKAIEFTLGRTLGARDRCFVDSTRQQAFERGRGSFVDLITAVVMNPAYQTVSPATAQ